MRRPKRFSYNKIIRAIKNFDRMFCSILQTPHELQQPHKFLESEVRPHFPRLLASFINMFWIKYQSRHTAIWVTTHFRAIVCRLPYRGTTCLNLSSMKMEDVCPSKRQGPITPCNDSEDPPPSRKSETSLCKNFPLTAVTPVIHDLRTT